MRPTAAIAPTAVIRVVRGVRAVVWDCVIRGFGVRDRAIRDCANRGFAALRPVLLVVMIPKPPVDEGGGAERRTTT